MENKTLDFERGERQCASCGKHTPFLEGQNYPMCGACIARGYNQNYPRCVVCDFPLGRTFAKESPCQNHDTGWQQCRFCLRHPGFAYIDGDSQGAPCSHCFAGWVSRSQIGTEAAEMIFENVKALLRDDYEIFLKRLEEQKNSPVGEFIQKILEWNTNETYQQQLAWEMFHRAINFDERNFFESLNSFVANCLLDDHAFLVEWRKPDYIHEIKIFGGKEFEHRNLQYLPGGEIKTKIVERDDPEGRPEVVWTNGDDGSSQDPNLILEAMEIFEQRYIAQIQKNEDILGRLKKLGPLLSIEKQEQKEQEKCPECPDRCDKHEEMKGRAK